MIFSRINVFVWLLSISLALILLSGHNVVDAAKKSSSASAPAAAPVVHEPVIEEVTQKQLERILQDKDYVAVYWCKLIKEKNCIQKKKKNKKTNEKFK